MPTYKGPTEINTRMSALPLAMNDGARRGGVCTAPRFVLGFLEGKKKIQQEIL